MTRVSLYVPCFNGERYIARCIEGILSQRRPANEVLIVDDGSTDGSVEIISKYPVTLVRHRQNRGLSAARNTGIRASSSGSSLPSTPTAWRAQGGSKLCCAAATRPVP